MTHVVKLSLRVDEAERVLEVHLEQVELRADT